MDKKKIKTGYAPVIGDFTRTVKLGSKEELLYFRVSSCSTRREQSENERNNTNKLFYLSPECYPGYEKMMETENGRKIISDWRKKQAETLEEMKKRTIKRGYIIVK